MQSKEVKPSRYTCAYCGEINHTIVDPSQGETQKYIEDCQVCCQPNTLSINYDEFSEKYIIQARPSQ